MQIADYIPSYPELTDDNFNDEILHKKEFYDLKSNVDLMKGPGDLWNHQVLMSRFVSPHTNYDKQIFFHKPGTGKTCGAVAVAEMNKLDPHLRKPVLILAGNNTLLDQWKRQIAEVCTGGQYLPDHWFSTTQGIRLTHGEKVHRLRKKLARYYNFDTLESFRKMIDKNSDATLNERFSNKLIIVDEAHNLRIQVGTTDKNKDSKARYRSFHRFFHLLEGTKILLLTGTPMYDRLVEIPGLLNLILPLDDQLPTGKAFSKAYMRVREDGTRKIIKQGELMEKMVGKVSYIREGGSFPDRIDLGENVWTNFIKTVNTQLSDEQLTGYLEAYRMDRKRAKKTAGLWSNSRQAASFIYPTKDGYLWGPAASKKLLTTSNKKITLHNKTVTYKSYAINQKYAPDIKDNLAVYSSKFAYAIQYILEHANEPIFIFTPLVSGGGGAIFFSAILQLFGYSRATGASSGQAKRFALITGEEKSGSMKNKLIQLFNSEKNRDGRIIQVMIATKTISEGTSFTNVMHELVLSPYWNNSGTEQAIGRGLRANSLNYLPDEERQVTVQELAMDSPNLPPEENIDRYLYQMSEAKDHEIKLMERILKKVAWDCAINYSRNVRKNDVEDSRNCDFQKCNYVCYQTSPNKTGKVWSYNVPDKELNKDTWLLYYSQPEMMKIVDGIRDILCKKPIINVNGLRKQLTLKNFKLIILALEYLIENHVTVYNKWGQACFLRRDGNVLFLSNLPMENSIFSAWYTIYPYLNQVTSLENIIADEYYEKDLLMLNEIDDCSVNNPQMQGILDSLSNESKILLVEKFVLMKDQYGGARKKRIEQFLNFFSDYLHQSDEQIVHILEKIPNPETDYIDFKGSASGQIKCLENGKWVVCASKKGEVLYKKLNLIKYKKQQSENPDIVDNEYGVYGKIEKDKFKIVDRTAEKGKNVSDRRKVSRGAVCTEAAWKQPKLVQLYAQLKLPLPDLTGDDKGRKTLDKIKKLKLASKETKQLKKMIEDYDIEIPSGASKKDLITILSLKQLDKKQLCDNLQRWFEDNNLMVYT